MAKPISLVNGCVAIVDDDDFDSLSAFEWWTNSPNNGHKTYARARINGRHVMMHQMLVSAPDGFEVDHRDGNGLNNQRGNLRIATREQNARNRRKMSQLTHPTSSRFKGVFLHRRDGWVAQLTISDRKVTKCRKTQLAAAREYDALAVQHFGEFARLNFPEAARQTAPCS